MLKPATTDIEALKTLDERLRWLSAWTIHHANHIRDSDDGLKVGGHQASCASMTAIMAALYFHALGPNDRVAVKPHAGPVLHAIHYLLGIAVARGAREFPRLRRRAILSQPDQGQDPGRFLDRLGRPRRRDHRSSPAWCRIISPRTAGSTKQDRGRFVALIGDAELDEGNIYEAIIEGAKHDVRNLWWIVDYNRQSLDATSADRMFERFDEIFRSCGWRVVELRYGKKLQAALDSQPDAQGLVREAVRTPSCRRSTTRAARRGGSASRRELGKKAAAFLKEYDDDALARRCSPTLAAIAWSPWSRRSTPRRTTSRPCSSPGRSRASACPSPATRTITPA